MTASQGGFSSTLEYALKYRRLGFSYIPILKGTKKPSVNWIRYQTSQPDEAQLRKWFEGTGDRFDLAIVTGRVSGIVEFDIDGEAARTHFQSALEKLQDSTTQNKIKNTMKIKTPGGNVNYVIGFRTSDFEVNEAVKSLVLWRGNEPHSEIRLKADGGYGVAPPSENPTGSRYELVDGILSPEILSKLELMELIAAIRQKKKGERLSKATASNQTHRKIDESRVNQIISLLKPHYQSGLRNDLVMCLAGWLMKEGVAIDSARKIIEGIYEHDEEKNARIRTLEDTYKKEDLNDVKGYSGLSEVLISELRDERQARTLLEELQGLLRDNRGNNSRQPDMMPQPTMTKATAIIEEASEAIMNKHRLLTVEETKEIWYYRNGVYGPGGEVLIEKEAEKLYEYDLANRHLSEIKGPIMRTTYHKREEIDSDLDIINLKNGLYNIATGEFSSHSPDYLSINQLPIVFDPKIKPGLLGEFLSEVLYPTEIRTAVELMAYTFLRDNPFEIITILFGYGANGKSVFTGLITALHGIRNVSNVPLSSMLEDMFALSDLEGKSVNIDTELTSTTIRDTVLKKLTGRQPTRIQRKNQRAYDTILHAKLFFSANKIPLHMTNLMHSFVEKSF